MILKKENVIRDSVSCNFCQKGQLKENIGGLNYPYENVITFKRSGFSGVCCSICDECLKELNQKSKELNKKQQ